VEVNDMRNLKARALSLTLGALTFGAVGALGALPPGVAHAASPHDGADSGFVYAQTNDASANSVLVFARHRDGTLTPAGAFPTGGTGTGATGISQGSVERSATGHLLVAVNAGSNQVSEFAVRGDGTLKLIDTVASGGTEPTSVAIHDHLVEVLNVGATADVAGFAATDSGLVPIAGGSQPLSAGASGAEDVLVSADGSHVVVTEKTSNTIDTFRIHTAGTLSPVVTSASDGPAAFAAVFSHGQLLVADAGGAGASALSPYRIAVDGTAVASGPVVPNAQSAACWITLGRNGNVFVANAGSSSISTYRALPDGTVGLFGNFNAGTNSKPLDLASSSQGQFLYELDGNNHVITGFTVGPNGQLSAISQQPIPASVAGLTAT